MEVFALSAVGLIVIAACGLGLSWYGFRLNGHLEDLLAAREEVIRALRTQVAQSEHLLSLSRRPFQVTPNTKKKTVAKKVKRPLWMDLDEKKTVTGPDRLPAWIQVNTKKVTKKRSSR